MPPFVSPYHVLPPSGVFARVHFNREDRELMCLRRFVARVVHVGRDKEFRDDRYRRLSRVVLCRVPRYAHDVVGATTLLSSRVLRNNRFRVVCVVAIPWELGGAVNGAGDWRILDHFFAWRVVSSMGLVFIRCEDVGFVRFLDQFRVVPR